MSSEYAAAGRRPLLLALAGALVVAALLLASLAPAAGAAPTALSPKNGKRFSVGAFLTYKVRDRSSQARHGGVFLNVADRKKTKKGQLKRSPSNASGDFAKMKRRKHGLYTYTPPHYTFPSWYMQKPDVYYWQAHHIDCGVGSTYNCNVVTKIRHFRVG